MRHGFTGLLASMAIVLLIAGCGSNASTTPTPAPVATTTAQAGTLPTSTVVPAATTTAAVQSQSTGTASPVASPDAAALDTAVSAVLQAMRTRDINRMRDLMGGQLRQQIRDQDLQKLMSCIPSGTTVTLADRSIEISGDTAKVTVTFNVSSSGGTPTTVERVWEFMRQSDGSWMLVSTPTCPFQ